MNDLVLTFLSFMFGVPVHKEKFDNMFDESFIKYFRDNPNGYDEVMKAVDEQVPEGIGGGIRERFNRLYEQSK